MNEHKTEDNIEQSQNKANIETDELKQKDKATIGKKKKPLYCKWSFWQSVIIIVITGSYTFFAYQQWKTIEKQSNILKKQIEATSDQFAIENRAWVTIFSAGLVNFKLGEFIIAQIIIKNSGNTPSIYTTINVNMGIINRSPSVISTFPDISNAENITSNTVFGPSVEMSSTLVGSEKLTKEMIEGLEQKKTYLYLWGRIIYDDIFGKNHYTEFCSYYSFESKGFTGCPYNNSTD